MQWKALLGIVGLSWVLNGTANAALLTWTVQGGSFNDGGTVSGTFVQDSASNTITSWNLAVAGGGGSFPARSYTPANSTVSTLGLGSAVASFLFAATDEASRQLRLTPVATLDGSSASVNLDVAFTNGNLECFNCSPFRSVSAGTLVLTAAAATVTIDSIDPSPTTVGTSTTVNVTVTGVAALGTPTGTVTVLDNASSPLCTLTLPATSCAFVPAAAGGQTLIAQYNGDANYTITLSNLAPLAIQAAVSVSTRAIPVLGLPALAALALLLAGFAVFRRR